MTLASGSPLVTIVTPSLNQGRYLATAIDSVLAQDYPHVEHLIFDGGSTDETAAVVARYSGRTTFVRESDRGQSHAINRGLRDARGEIFQWLNADDWLEPGCLAAVVEAFRRAPQAGAVYGHGRVADGAGRPSGAAYRAPVPFDLRRLLFVCDTLAQPSCFLRRDAVLAVGGVDETLHWAMDWDLYLRLAFRFRFIPVDRELATWREYPETKTRSGGWRRFRELVRVLRRHGGRRFPPAYFLYFAQTVEFLAARRAERRGAESPSRTPGALECAARRAQQRIWKRTMQWYPDAWVAPRFELLLARQPGRLRLRGELPDLPELCPGQRLVVSAGGDAIATCALDLGPFECWVDPPPGDGPLRLEIRARRSFVPGRRRGTPDDRRLAYRLHAVDWVASDPT